MSSTNHILSSDNVLGVRIQPKFTSEFMTTPIADFVSKFQIPYDSDVYDVQQHISSVLLSSILNLLIIHHRFQMLMVVIL